MTLPSGPEPTGSPIEPSGGGPVYREPAWLTAMSFVSTAMLVGGIGLAWTGLLLAAAGVVLQVIELRETRRYNPWVMEKGAEEWPIMAPGPQRVSRVSFATIVLAAAVALGAVQVTGDALAALPPAAIAGVTSLVFGRLMKRELEAAARR